MTSQDKLLDLSSKTALVTGGALGIGFGIAYRLAEAGAKVMIGDLKEARGINAQSYIADVSKEEDVKNLVNHTVDTFGSIDILINNAGIYPNVPVSQMSLEDFEKVLAVNLKGVFLCTKYVSEQMIKRGKGGKIINVTSIDALHPSSIGLAHYDASKHGVWGFTKNTALELAPYKIWVNAIAPGAILTEGVEKLQLDAQVIERFQVKIPMHRMGEPDDIGKVALFLASDMSSYMTGTQVVVDGGVLLS